MTPTIADNFPGRPADEKSVSQEQICEVADLLPNLIWVAGDDGWRTYFNPAWLKFTGHSLEQGRGMGWTEAIHPQDRAKCLKTYEKQFLSRQPFVMEYRLKRANGSYAWVVDCAQPRFGINGEFAGFIGSCLDIHRRKRLEGSLRVSEERKRLVLQTAMDGFWVMDVAGKFLEVNAAFCRMTGYLREDLLGLHIDDVEASENPEEIQEHVGRIIKDGSDRFETRHRRKDGTTVDVEVSVNYTRHSRQFFCFVRDISQRKQTEQTLRESELRFRSMAQSASDAIISVDQKGEIILWNGAAESIFGYTAAEAMGQCINMIMPEEYRTGHLDAIGRFARTGESHVIGKTVELCGLHKSGEVFPIELSLSAWHSKGQTYFTSIIRDIRLRKRAEWMESDRRQALEMVMRNQPLAGIVSHLVQMVERQFGGAVASVLLLDDGNMSLVAPNLPPELANLINGQAIHLAADLCSGELDSEQHVIVSDMANDPRWGECGKSAAAQGLVNCWSVPLRSGEDEPLGLLSIYFRSHRTPGPEDRGLLEMVNSLTAIIAEHRRLAIQLAFRAQHDPLTGLPNRLLFEERMQQALRDAGHDGGQAGLLYVDMDYFKRINDSLGHAAGDILIRQLSQRMSGELSRGQVLGRLGGDEFAIILPELSDPQEAVHMGQRLLNSLKAPFSISGHELFINVTIGVAVYPQDGSDAETLQRHADAAMYRAKHRGRGCIECFAPEMNAAAVEKLELENDLRQALDRNQLELHYQPQVDQVGRVIGVEALLRWHHPRRGMISPVQFIPLAEEGGLIVPIGKWVLLEACRQSAAWQKAGCPPVQMGVNVSPLQFVHAGFVEMVAEARRTYRQSPLVLEITEGLLMRHTADVASKLAEVRSLGAELSIDDFGTGYSSLAYLQRLPIDTLKIDRSFVCEIAANQPGNGAPIIRAIVSMAQSLGVGVVAEGVETAYQRDFLGTIGCRIMQGYLFGRPAPADVIEKVLLSGQCLPTGVTEVRKSA